MSDLPLDTIFELGPSLTEAQTDFLDTYGFVHFRGVASHDEVARLTEEHERICDGHVAEGRKSVYGVPIFYGRDEAGDTLLNRSPFSSVYSEVIRDFVRDERFEPIRRLNGLTRHKTMLAEWARAHSANRAHSAEFAPIRQQLSIFTMFCAHPNRAHSAEKGTNC